MAISCDSLEDTWKLFLCYKPDPLCPKLEGIRHKKATSLTSSNWILRQSKLEKDSGNVDHLLKRLKVKLTSEIINKAFRVTHIFVLFQASLYLKIPDWNQNVEFGGHNSDHCIPHIIDMPWIHIAWAALNGSGGMKQREFKTFTAS